MAVTSTLQAEDVVTLLSPQPALKKSLVDFVEGYRNASDAFRSLIAYPFLEKIDILLSSGGETSVSDDQPNLGFDEKKRNSTDDESNLGTDEKKKNLDSGSQLLGPTQTSTGNLRSLVLDLQQQFRLCADAEKDSARQLKSYGDTVQLLVSNQLPPIQLKEILGPAIQDNIAKAATRSTFKEKEYEKFSATQARLNEAIDNASQGLLALDSQLKSQSTRVKEQKPIIQRLRELLFKLFTFAASDEEFKLQIALLLDVPLSSLEGDIESVQNDRAIRDQLQKSFDTLQRQLIDINKALKKLGPSIETSIQATKVLQTGWTDIQTRVGQLELTRPLTTEEVKSVSTAWVETSTAAESFIKGVDGAITGTRSPISGTSRYIPTTSTELGAMKSFIRIKPQYLEYTAPQKFAISRMASSNLILNTLISNAAPNLNIGSTDEAKKKLEELFSPPPVAEKLEDLTNDFKGLAQKFDEVLSVPFIEAFEIDNPYYPVIPGPDNVEPKKIDIKTFARRFKEAYLRLQDDAVPVIRKLKYLAEIQIQLIPLIAIPNSGEKAPEGKATPEDYRDMVKPIVKQAEAETKDMETKHVAFGRMWSDAIVNLDKAIAESKQNAQITSDKLKVKLQELKDSHSTLWGVFAMIGAVACFAAAVVFVPLGTVVFGSACLILMGTAANQFTKKDDLNAAISGLQQALNTAGEQTKRLEALKNPMLKVKACIDQLTSMWRDLADLLDGLSSMLDSPVFGNLFKFIVLGNPANVDSGAVNKWRKVVLICDQYISLLSGGTQFNFPTV